MGERVQGRRHYGIMFAGWRFFRGWCVVCGEEVVGFWRFVV